MERESDTHHVLDDRDGFREVLNPSYELCQASLEVRHVAVQSAKAPRIAAGIESLSGWAIRARNTRSTLPPIT